MLLVFQTLLSPLSVFAAEAPSTPPVDKDNVTDLTKGGTDENLSTSPVDNGTDLIESDSNEEDLSTNQPENEGTEQVPEGEIAEDVGDASKEEDKDEETATDDSAKIVPLNVGPPDQVVDRDGEKFKEQIVLTIDGTPVTGTSVEGKVGDTIKFRVDLSLEPGHTYGEGSILTYELPAQFSGLTGNKQLFYNGEVIGKVAVSGQSVSITFTDAIRDEKGVGTLVEDMFFEITGTLQSANNSWSETIQVPGFQDITLDFTPVSKGSAITKSGVADNDAKNSEYITWTVDVNTNLAVNTDGGTTTFTDTLTGAHTFDSIESISELNISPNGAITEGAKITPLPTIVGTTMSLELPNKAHTGYRIVYKTKVNDLGIIPPAKFDNTASYNGITIPKVTVEVGFDTPLEKIVSKPKVESQGVVTTEWTIKYNHNKRTIPAGSAKLSDTWTTGHELYGSVEVYKNGSLTPETSDSYKVTSKTDGLGFDLEFQDGVADAYTIKYKTKPDTNTYPTTNRTITNTVTREDFTDHTGLKNKVDTTYSPEIFVLNKTAEGVNYEAKTMDWKIVANQAKYTLAVGTIFTDTYGGSYLTLKDGLTVKAGGITLTAGTDYELVKTDDTVDGQTRETGFVIKLLKSVSDQMEIEYTTDYEIKDTGTNTRVYKNQVTLSDTGIPNFGTSTDSATQDIVGEQKANGKKTGSYNYETKTFHWDVELNFNYNTITNAIFKDILPASQTVTELKVVKGTLSAGGNFVPSTDPNDTKTIDVTNIKNEIVLELGTITTPYKVTYQSKDANAVYPHGSLITISNEAKLFSQGNENSPNATWHKDVPVAHTEKIIDKKGTSTSTSPQVNWNFKFNYAQSQLSNIVITDTVGKIDGDPAQLILKDSFKVWEMNFKGTDSTPVKGQQVTLTDENLTVDTVAGTFELKLPNGDKAYYVEYSTVFMGPSGSKVDNIVNVSYVSEEGNSGSSVVNDLVFKYDAGGKVGTVPFVILKTDAATGMPMDNVKFDLYGPYTGNTLLTSGLTNADGYLNYGLKLAPSANATKKYKVVEETQVGYEPLTQEFVLDRDKIEKSGKYAGYQVIKIENKPLTGFKCDKFELTIYDVDGNKVNNEKVKLVNKTTGVEEEYTVTNGTMIFKREAAVSGSEPILQAGKYDVIYDGETLKEITVEYNDMCNAEIQPAPKCENFTIVVKDEQGNIRKNITELTLKQGTTVVKKVSPGAEGKFIVDSNKNNPADGVKPGEYTLYEGNQFLGTVVLTYMKSCDYEFTVIQAPKCETFELTVKDVDGELVADNTEVTIKDISGKTVATEKTKDGKVELKDLEPGVYQVFDKDGNKIGDFSSNINCQAVVQQKPACDRFTVELKDENNVLVKAGKDVVIKDKSGNVIPTVIEADGSMTFASEDVPAGEYLVYDNKVYLGKIVVSYKLTCKTALTIAPSCPDFTLTINNMYGQPRVGVKVTITSEDGLAVEESGSPEFVTDSKGQITISNSIIKPGKYIVRENGKTIIGTVIVGNTCEAKIQPIPPTTDPNNPDPGQPVDPNNPDPNKPVDPNNPDPNKPVDPNNPDPNKPVDPNNPDPNKPVDPNNPDPNKPVDPNNPDPNKPVDPNNPDPNKPVDPNNPDPNKPVDPNNPDPNKPVDPNNPDPNKPVDPNNPDPNKPVDPNNPDPNKPVDPNNPDPNKPVDPNNPSTPGDGGTSVQNIIDQGKQLPPYNPSNATKDTLDAYKDFLDNYSKLSKDQQAEVAQSIDINKIKADAERLEALLRAQGKLPQTDGANQTALVFVGLLLVFGAVWLMRRRQTEA